PAQKNRPPPRGFDPLGGGLWLNDPGDNRLSRLWHYHGPGGLNGRVRNGNGCGPAGMVAGKAGGGPSGHAARGGSGGGRAGVGRLRGGGGTAPSLVHGVMGPPDASMGVRHRTGASGTSSFDHRRSRPPR